MSRIFSDHASLDPSILLCSCGDLHLVRISRAAACLVLQFVRTISIQQNFILRLDRRLSIHHHFPSYNTSSAVSYVSPHWSLSVSSGLEIPDHETLPVTSNIEYGAYPSSQETPIRCRNGTKTLRRRGSLIPIEMCNQALQHQKL